MKNFFIAVFSISTIAGVFYTLNLSQKFDKSQQDYLSEIERINTTLNENETTIIKLKQSQEAELIEIKSKHQKHLAELQNALNTTKNENKSLQKMNLELNKSLVEERSEVKQLKTANSSLEDSVMQKEHHLKASQEKLKEKEKENPIANMMMQFMENEGMNDMLNKEAEQEHNKLWGDFGKDIDPILFDAFNKKMKEYQLIQMEQVMQIFSNGKKGRDQFSRDIDAVNQKHEEELMDILGIDGYTKYEEYKKTLSARTQFSAMEASGFRLNDPIKKKQILQMISNTHEQFGIDYKTDQMMTLGINNSDSKMENFWEREEKLSQEYKIRAQQILTQDELTQFNHSLDQYTREIKMDAEMVNMLFNNKSNSLH